MKAHPKKQSAYNKKYHAKSEVKERRKLVGRLYRHAFPGKAHAKRGRRIAAQLNAVPPWSNRDAIEALYSEAKRLTKETGIQHHVDHIWPLQGVGFCGLHVEWNLQVLTRDQNIAKSNKRPDSLQP